MDIQGTAPSRGRNLCTDPQLSALLAACLSAGSSGATCDAYINANTDCARCTLGALAGDPAATTPVGAMIPASDDSTAPNIAACAALTINRADCALPLTRQTVCLLSACASCLDDPTEGACLKTAEANVCRTVMDAPCNAALNASQAAWVPVCRGTSFADTYMKVARVLCGP